jgi:hypothetical protein
MRGSVASAAVSVRFGDPTMPSRIEKMPKNARKSSWSVESRDHLLNSHLRAGSQGFAAV